MGSQWLTVTFQPRILTLMCTGRGVVCVGFGEMKRRPPFTRKAGKCTWSHPNSPRRCFVAGRTGLERRGGGPRAPTSASLRGPGCPVPTLALRFPSPPAPSGSAASRGQLLGWGRVTLSLKWPAPGLGDHEGEGWVKGAGWGQLTPGPPLLSHVVTEHLEWG